MVMMGIRTRFSVFVAAVVGVSALILAVHIYYDLIIQQSWYIGALLCSLFALAIALTWLSKKLGLHENPGGKH